jgi:urease accessory protein
MPGPRPATRMIPEPGRGLYRLLAWLSPSFPIGAFSYSHGLEAAVAAGAVHDRATLAGWIAAILAHGSGRIDADILCAAHRAAASGDMGALMAANRRGVAYRATAELARESAQQGAAFLATWRAAWSEPFLAAWEPGEEVCHSALFGAAAGRAGIALADALLGYLEAFAGSLVSAGLRLGLIGQTDGQRILAALEPRVADAAAAAMAREEADFGAATFAVDLAAMAHETQYSRLFRS